MSIQLEIPAEAVADFCQRNRITELALFGSVLRDDFRPDSDVDVLVRFEPNAGHGLFDLVRMEDELCEILGRPVDLVTRKAIEHSPNHLRRRMILDSAEVIYAA